MQKITIKHLLTNNYYYVKIYYNIICKGELMNNFVKKLFIVICLIGLVFSARIYKNNKIISAEETIYTINISDYCYTDSVSVPELSSDYDGYVTFYYNTVNNNVGGILWSELTPVTLDVGTYYIYGVSNDFVTDCVQFNVNRKDIKDANVVLVKGLTYNGEVQYQQVQSVTINGYPVTYTVSGNACQDVAPRYILTVAGTDNFCGAVNKEFSLRQANNSIDELYIENWTYGEEPKEPIYSAKFGEPYFDFAVKGTNDFTYEIPTEAGEYTLKAYIPEEANFKSATKMIDFKIEKAFVNKPSKDNTVYYYNGEDQTYNIAENEYYTVSNNQRKDIGTQQVIISLKSKQSSCWTDGTTDDLIYDFTINKIVVTIPRMDSKTFFYTGKEQVYTLLLSEFYKVENNKRTESGTQIVKAILLDKDYYMWSNGSTDDIEYIFTINKRTITRPAADMSSHKYTGYYVYYGISKNDAYTITGNVQIDVGSYLVTVSLNDKNNYIWSDNTIDDIVFNFEIKEPVIYLYSDKDGNQIETPAIVLDSQNGFETNTVMVVETTSGNAVTKNVGQILKQEKEIKSNQKVVYVYDLKIMEDGQNVQPNGYVTIQLKLPDNIKGDYKIYHIHQNADDSYSTEELKYIQEDDIIIINVNRFSQFAFVVDSNKSIIPVIIVIAIIVIIIMVAFIIIKGKKNKKLLQANITDQNSSDIEVRNNTNINM